ncbi:MAG: hypothetical protein N3D82_04650 [Ignisphaera sp.]|nr:hypothetical protein [Ignisphaera sp.]MCX8168299.1 hypothetical protein [Ignisphaera sp.]MDW8085881.1 hypothetical protein [Ignisphaera sp.]
MAIIGVMFIGSVKGGCILDAIACSGEMLKRVGIESVDLMESKTVYKKAGTGVVRW